MKGFFNPRPAGASVRTHLAGGGVGVGGQLLPPCLTHERLVVAGRAKRQSKAHNEYFLSKLKILKRL